MRNRTECCSARRIRRLNDGEFEFVERHFPGIPGAAALRRETYPVPAGAQVLETAPPDMNRRQLPDGRIELRTRKIIPPDGNITVRIRFQQ